MIWSNNGFFKILKSWKWKWPPKNTYFGGSFSFPWFQDFKKCVCGDLYKHLLLQIWRRHRKYWTMRLGSSTVSCHHGDEGKIVALIPRGYYSKWFILHSSNTAFKILKSWKRKTPLKNAFYSLFVIIRFVALPYFNLSETNCLLHCVNMSFFVGVFHFHDFKILKIVFVFVFCLYTYICLSFYQ